MLVLGLCCEIVVVIDFCIKGCKIKINGCSNVIVVGIIVGVFVGIVSFGCLIIIC